MLDVLGDGRQANVEARALVGAGVEDHAVDTELVSGFEVAGERALRPLAERCVVARQVDQVDRVEVEGRAAVLLGRLLEGRDASLVQLGRAPETRRCRMDLDRLRSHRRGSLVGEVQSTAGVDVRANQGSPRTHGLSL